MPTIDVLLADAHLLVREGLKSLLSDQEDIRIIAEATDSEDLQKELTQHHPDVVIMDYDLRGYFKVDDVQRVKKSSPETEVLVITANLNRDSVFKVLEFGANSFLLKECDKEEIVGAIRASANKEKFFCHKVLDVLMNKSVAEPTEQACYPTLLTARETEVVRLVAEGNTTNKIAEELCLSVHTVNTHRKNIMRKLEVKTTAELVMYAVNTAIVTPAS